VQYHSTRYGAPPAGFAEVLVSGLAPDGGLYQPDEIPRLPEGWREWDYVSCLDWSLGAFGAEGPRPLIEEAAAGYFHPEITPLRDVGDRLVYELFWGPTLSFKDHALQVLGRLLGRAVDGPRTVLGATSGDTGSAAIAGCKDQPLLTTVVLFPEGMITEFQRLQMTTVPNENVRAVAVRGTFDDCQRMVKDAFGRHDKLLAVNSINWARIAAQAGYYIRLGTLVGGEFDVVVPTGNFGNVYSCWLAKQMGVPIETITIANNANHSLSDIVTGIPVEAGPVTPTLAPAMDIAAPSNLERFQHDPTLEFSAGWVDDQQMLATISEVHSRHGYLLDPHTAAGWAVGEKTRGERPQVVVATAHPAKFASAVKTAIGTQPSLPNGYPSPMALPERMVTIDVSATALDDLIR
jgi:threonine synthase